MKRSQLILCSLLAIGASANADTVLFSENFDSDYSASFPYIYDCDDQEPASTVRALFLGSDGTYQPWWHLKDFSADTDRYLASHSCYSTPGESNDWLGSSAIEIPSEGFILSFDAESYTFGKADNLSSLWLYITESPLDKHNLPDTPTAIYENISEGTDTEIIVGDFTHYTLDLSEYAGKTIYLNFANKNYDKGLLCLDNIKVSRTDNIEVTLEDYPAFIYEETYSVTVHFEALNAVENWSVTLTDSNGSETCTGNGVAADGETLTFTRNIAADCTENFRIDVVADNEPAVTCTGTVSRPLFEAYRKLLVEESTGMWCGWCPGGIYTVEKMLEDEEMSQYVIPVSVHVGSDNLAMPNYGVKLGAESNAPLFYLNRKYIGGPSSSLDYNFDKTRQGSLAKRIADEHLTSTPAEISVSGNFIYDGETATSIECKASVKAALSGDYSNYRIGFILVENDVNLPNSSYFMQTNYLSGYTDEGYLEYWSELPKYVAGFHYNDVARNIEDFDGIKSIKLATLKAGEENEFSYTMEIPDMTIYTTDGVLAAPAIRPDYCELIAFLIDTESGEIMNADSFTIGEHGEERYTTKMYYEASGVTDILEESVEGAPVYYDLQGRRVQNPERGIYILRNGSHASKICF